MPLQPIMYIQRAIAINEFAAPRWKNLYIGGESVSVSGAVPVFAVHVFAQRCSLVRSTGLQLGAQASEPPLEASRGLSQLLRAGTGTCAGWLQGWQPVLHIHMCQSVSNTGGHCSEDRSMSKAACRIEVALTPTLLRAYSI